MSKTEEKNITNYLSVADELYLEKMFKTEKQINEILLQIENLTDTLSDIQQKMEGNTDMISSLNKSDIEQNIEDISDSIASLYKDYPKNKKDDNDILEDFLQDTKNECDKKRGRRYKGKAKSSKRKFSWIGEIVFYAVIIAVVLGAFLVRSNKSGKPTAIAGYSLFTVLTGSMESEIPQGSLVITKQMDTKSLQIGDDITFMANQTTVVTHRIIAIIENYQETGQRAFQTKGVMNVNPDKNLVPAVNVIGKVVYHNKFLGQIASYVGENWTFLIFVVIVICIFVNFLKSAFKNNEDVETNDTQNELLQRVSKVNRRKEKRI